MELMGGHGGSWMVRLVVKGYGHVLHLVDVGWLDWVFFFFLGGFV